MAKQRKRRYEAIFDNEELDQIADDLQREWFNSAGGVFRVSLKMFLVELKEHGYEIRKVN